MDISLATEPFILVSKPYQKCVEGFPLDSLSKDIVTNEYYYDLNMEDLSNSALEEGVKSLKKLLEIEK